MCLRYRECECERERECVLVGWESLRYLSCSCTRRWVSEFITWPSGIYFFSYFFTLLSNQFSFISVARSLSFSFFFRFDSSCGNFCPYIADEAALSFLHKKLFFLSSPLLSSGLELVKSSSRTSSSIPPPFTVPRLIRLFSRRHVHRQQRSSVWRPGWCLSLRYKYVFMRSRIFSWANYTLGENCVRYKLLSYQWTGTSNCG